MIADIVRRLGAAGCTIEQIAVAVEIAEQEALVKQQKRRRAAADRQARHRDKRYVTPVGVTECDPPQAYTSPPEVEKPKRVSLLRKREIPPDFVPDLEVATGHGWPLDRAKSEAVRFCDHARATGRKLVDWPAGWRNWVTSPYQNKENSDGRPGKRTIMEAADDLVHAVRGFDAPAPSSLCEPARPPYARLLSKG